MSRLDFIIFAMALLFASALLRACYLFENDYRAHQVHRPTATACEQEGPVDRLEVDAARWLTFDAEHCVCAHPWGGCYIDNSMGLER